MEHLSYCSILYLRTICIFFNKILVPQKPEWDSIPFWGSLMLSSGLLNSVMGQMPVLGTSVSICAALSIWMELLLIKERAQAFVTTVEEVWTNRGWVKSSHRLPAAFSDPDCCSGTISYQTSFLQGCYSFHSWKTAVTEWKRKDSCKPDDHSALGKLIVTLCSTRWPILEYSESQGHQNESFWQYFYAGHRYKDINFENKGLHSLFACTTLHCYQWDVYVQKKLWICQPTLKASWKISR